ncbi:MAG: hypothetical protein E2O52_07490 [Gammaproteobacteria bacterium]|nr:MAG: hypothetical protein E2O52_07490 [Gammaproteobacteria bacterium]
MNAYTNEVVLRSAPVRQDSRVFRSRVTAVSVVFLCLLLAGCSATRVLYNQLDWVVIWYLDGYFSLDEAQEEQLRETVTRNFEWHRRTQLPRYAQYCRELERESRGVLTADILEERYQRTIELWDELIGQATPGIAAFFLTLTDEQIDEFIVNLEENNQELWEKYGGETPEERRARRQKGAIKGFKRVIGRLNSEQQALVRVYMANMHDVSEEWMAGRRRWQQAFRTLLVERPAEPEFSERFLQLMMDPNRTDEPEYREKVAANRKLTFDMIIALSAQLTDAQRERLSGRLLRYARDFEILAGQKM